MSDGNVASTSTRFDGETGVDNDIGCSLIAEVAVGVGWGQGRTRVEFQKFRRSNLLHCGENEMRGSPPPSHLQVETEAIG